MGYFYLWVPRFETFWFGGSTHHFTASLIQESRKWKINIDRIGWNLDEDPRLKSLRQTYSNYHVQKKFDMMSYTSGLLRRFPEATDSAVFFQIESLNTQTDYQQSWMVSLNVCTCVVHVPPIIALSPLVRLKRKLLITSTNNLFCPLYPLSSSSNNQDYQKVD